MPEPIVAAVTETPTQAAPATPAEPKRVAVPGAITSNGFSPPEESRATSFLVKARAEMAAKAAEEAAKAQPDDSEAADASDGASEDDVASPDDAGSGQVEKKDGAPSPKVDDLKKLAAEGEWEKLARELGVDPNGQKLPSNRFAEFRKHQAKERAKLEHSVAIERRPH